MPFVVFLSALLVGSRASQHITGTTRRSTSKAVAVCSAGALLLAAFATATHAGSRKPQAQVFALIDTTASTSERERLLLLGQMRRVVLPEALKRKAHLQVEALGGSSDTRPVVLAEADLAAQSDNPYVADDYLKATTATFMKSLESGLAGLPLDGTSNPVAALRRMSDYFSDTPDSSHLGIMLGDGVSTVDGCNFELLLQGDAPDLAQAERACVGRHRISLRGAEVWIGGVGVDLDQHLATDFALDIRDLLRRIVTHAGGRVTRMAADLTPATRR